MSATNPKEITYVNSPPEWLPNSIFAVTKPHENDVLEDVRREIAEQLDTGIPAPPKDRKEAPKDLLTPYERIETKIRQIDNTVQIRMYAMSETPESAIVPVPNPDQPPPEVPVVKHRPISEMESLQKTRARACMDRHDYALYVAAWNSWTQEYGSDEIHPSDLVDIHAICMNTVREAREETIRARLPDKYNHRVVEFARKEIQQARENLGARKIDREAKARGPANKSINIAVIAGQVASSHNMEKLQARVVENQNQITSFFEESQEVDPYDPQTLIDKKNDKQDKE